MRLKLNRIGIKIINPNAAAENTIIDQITQRTIDVVRTITDMDIKNIATGINDKIPNMYNDNLNSGLNLLLKYICKLLH